jgi:dihydroxyacetone kinase-like predicted kinase
MINSINPKQLIDIFKQAEKIVKSKKEILNNLNVYPVPDGDTGTNMYLTLKEIVKSFDKNKEYSLSELAELISESSLMGGRGNSGVILSQFLSGFCEVIKNEKSITKNILLKAFKIGTKEAYTSVSKPVEGTILTVMKSSSEEMGKQQQETDLIKILKSTINKSQATLKQTPEMLPKLKEAGVVDAGGAGFVYFLEGIYRALIDNGTTDISATDDFTSSKISRIWEDTSGAFGTGGIRSIIDFNIKAVKFMASNVIWILKKVWHVIKAGGNLISIKKAIRLFKSLSSQLKWQNIKKSNLSIQNLLRAWQKEPDERYCFEAIISNTKMPAKKVRKEISKIGSSAIVAQKGKLTKVHFHTKNKEAAEKLVKSIGSVKKIKIDDLHKEHKEFMSKRLEKSVNDGTKVIAVTNGLGFTQIYESFEGVMTINGGKTMNPSVSDFKKAISNINYSNIIILPNNKNVFMAAEKSQINSKNNIKIIKTSDQVQGLTTLLNFNPQSDINQNSEMMNNSLNLINTFSITKTTRDTTFSGKKVKKDEFIAIMRNKLLSKGSTIKAVIKEAIKKELNNSQLISIYYGQNTDHIKAETIRRMISEKFKVETQLHKGSQPHYYYIVSIE